MAAFCDLLKFECFFAEKDEFRREIAAEVAYHDPDWEKHLAAGDPTGVLGRFRPLTSHPGAAPSVRVVPARRRCAGRP